MCSQSTTPPPPNTPAGASSALPCTPPLHPSCSARHPLRLRRSLARPPSRKELVASPSVLLKESLLSSSTPHHTLSLQSSPSHAQSTNVRVTGTHDAVIHAS
ncbi:hypothetical protein TRVL_03929 [Trypanosoma vivax]|nr:hypothetical protein TRVL_03929 [Trypanosoma vivax]